MNFNLNILIVDDSSPMLRIIKKALNKIKINNVFQASNGEEALKILVKSNIDLVISDWNMPVMDGITLLKKAKTNSKLKNVPFVMLTAEAVKAKILEAAKYKIEDYIVKPFSEETFVYKITRVLTRISKLKKDAETTDDIRTSIISNRPITDDVDSFLDSL